MEGHNTDDVKGIEKANLNAIRVNRGGFQAVSTLIRGSLVKLHILLKRMWGNHLPLEKNVVLFDSHNGHYNDNPRYISEALHEADPQIRIVWAVSEGKGRDQLPDYVEKVQDKSKEFERLVYCANVVVDSMIGLNCVGGVPFKSEVLRRISRRNDQLCISTWHGTPLKKVGKDVWNNNWIKDYLTNTDYFVAGCDYVADIFENAFFLHGKVKRYGTPRNDVLFRRTLDVNAIKKKLHLPLDKKIVLYAPTFRDVSVEWSGVAQMKMLNIEKLLNALNQRFGEGQEFIFVFRVHHRVRDIVDSQSILAPYGEIVIDGNCGDDMAEYLACTDVLVSDYSGSLFDYALLGRPSFCFAPDRKQYEMERGFYRNFDWLPFPKAYTSEELLEQIAAFDEKTYHEKLEAFMEELGNFEDGHASERVVNDILKFIRTGKK